MGTRLCKVFLLNCNIKTQYNNIVITVIHNTINVICYMYTVLVSLGKQLIKSNG